MFSLVWWVPCIFIVSFGGTGFGIKQNKLHFLTFAFLFEGKYWSIYAFNLSWYWWNKSCFTVTKNFSANSCVQFFKNVQIFCFVFVPHPECSIVNPGWLCTPFWSWRHYGMPGIGPRSAMCKASSLPTVISLHSWLHIFFKSSHSGAGAIAQR